MSVDLDLAALHRVADDATPGPWGAAPIEAWGEMYTDVYPVLSVHESCDSDEAHACMDPLDDADAEFIATFDPPTVKALLKRLEAAEARIAEAMAIEEWTIKPATMLGYEFDEAEGYNQAREEFRVALTATLGGTDG